ncbi:2-oxo acid dehydrogenase subunit E2 [Actinoplanes sp. TBRC 11911]|uniref:dihydrolipoamide acetyltransferase family protein n=1 Tax=Actinoplanes sp. TBRC 11911 TaxID=2729386 RepID=UPI00145C6C74|nr:dihydrolipoamide acetyltransferase family protein [Actinoplanes sp. TBRC 11911]NMO49635.1 2-oxo acid dehydrogenase subunit E2 [Actinoplanes sp. TBRC 11911]
MPAISANVVEAVLSEWPLAENAAFAQGDPIATVETDKAVVDVPADSDGVLLRMLVEPGKAVSVGTPMALLAEPGEVVDDIDALVRALIGAASPPVPDEPAPAGDREVSQNAAERELASTAGQRVFASPLARRLARENGLRVEDLDGTGPGGRIVRSDIHRALAARAAVRPVPNGVAPSSDRPQVAGPSRTEPAVVDDAPAGYDEIPHSRMRRAIASRLGTAAGQTPVFTIRGSARVDALLALRTELNAATDVKISLNDLVVAAAARTHVAIPDMNVVWTDDAVRRFHDVDLAIAVATDSGLVTPVMRGLQSLTVSALARRSAELVARARDGKLRQDELDGGTLTVTNLGVHGTEEFTAVINPPQAAILAVGAARPEVVAVDGQPAVATVLRVSLSVDHRPVDGVLGARWMAHFLGLLEAPVRILV